ncbi:MAG: 3-deoxy-manno-octulosonate cytidylyltransferase, partial [Firmicutes bacterium]|nr:3-deoxy-manno-octulosonate cytidylyltransferase [Bacillota bacterium]
MKITAIIPARYNSSRFQGKPLADIHGKPMIWWVYQQTKKVTEFDDIIVATDHEKIMQACQNLNINAIMTSDKHPTGTDRLTEVAEKIHADWYINVQGDEPLIEPETIKALLPYNIPKNVQVIHLKSKIVNPIDAVNPTILKALTNAENKAIFITRAAAPFPKGSITHDYYRQVSLYAYTKAALEFFKNTPRGRLETIEDIETLRFLENGWDIQYVDVISNAIAVDTPHDLEKVRQILTPPPP